MGLLCTDGEPLQRFYQSYNHIGVFWGLFYLGWASTHVSWCRVWVQHKETSSLRTDTLVIRTGKGNAFWAVTAPTWVWGGHAEQPPAHLQALQAAQGKAPPAAQPHMPNRVGQLPQSPQHWDALA